jgi:hypothetical protein
MISSASGMTLLRLDPQTLRIAARWPFATDRAWGFMSLALAGGALWAAPDRYLTRFSLPSGKVTARVRIPRANDVDLAADAAGTMLLVGEARDGIGAVQRRDPLSGALQASSPVLYGVVAPRVTSAIGDSVWISEPTGMQGYVERLDTRTLQLDRRTLVEGSNGIIARLALGRIWITQPAGGAAHNYCADPRAGLVLAPLPAVVASAAAAVVLAVDNHHIYYGPQTSLSVQTAPLPPACRTWRWASSYTGDANNEPTSSTCGTEQFTILNH